MRYDCLFFVFRCVKCSFLSGKCLKISVFCSIIVVDFVNLFVGCDNGWMNQNLEVCFFDEWF